MRSLKRILIGVFAFVMFVVGGFAGYGWWTRRGTPSFSQGGAFGVGAPVPPARMADEQPVAAAGAPGGAVQKTGHSKTSSTTVQRGPVAIAARAGAPAVFLPREGTYHFASSGHEKVTFAGTSPCSWDLNGSDVVVKPNDRDVVFDWTYSSQRQERLIQRYSADGMYTVFVGAAVTCLGVRKTSEGTYKPPALRIAMPLKVGSHWTGESSTADRTEKIDGRIMSRTMLSVPAGRFDAYEVHLRAVLSGNQTGLYEATFWFSPTIGTIIKSHAHTDVDGSGAHFTSDIDLALARRP